ncbi:MAG TPA: hypothetical protein VEH78_01790 [Pseudolabrys sp.]|nr:hypothetical protein [Pseudolabrys sp.]
MLGFPLLLVPFAIYNIIAFLMPGVGWTSALISIHMSSGAECSLSPGDLLIILAILLLFGEVIKSTRIGVRTVVDHALSLLLFVGMLVEFILVKQAATAIFFLLLVIGFIDVLSGFIVTLRSAQRDVTVEGVEHVSS